VSDLSDKIALLKKLHGESSPGDWSVHATSEYWIKDGNDEVIGYLGGHHNLVNNGEFIAAAHNLLPEILDECELWKNRAEAAVQLANEYQAEEGLLKAEIERMASALRDLKDHSVKQQGEIERLRALVDEILPVVSEYAPGFTLWIEAAKAALGESK